MLVMEMSILKWGLIGCGDISERRVAPALRDLPNCELVAVNRQDYSKAESFAKKFGAKRWYEDWSDLINDDEIDAVYIATPVYLHAEQTIAAARAGKHILCEKPMAMSVAECDAMIEATSLHNVTLGVAYYRHFYPVVFQIKELIKNGNIGQIVTVLIKAFSHYNPSPGEPRYWLLEPEKSGGGPMMDFGCHRIEVLLDVFGPIKKTTSIVNRLHFERQVEDSATAFFEFDSGVHGILSAHHSVFESKDSIEIYGTAGSLYIENLNKGELRITTKDGERTEHLPPHANLHLPHIENFTQAVFKNEQPGVNGEQGRAVSVVLDEIYRKA
jgi:predicted dehydrogenase